MIVSIETPTKCTKCGSSALVQETDVLDTWFSSALWPHSTLGWPEQTEDLKYFYPTSVMVTGYDILFFWVARMIMMGLEDMNDIPFETVYLNGLIRDEKGHKMSKVRRNVINPLKVIDKYGTDALRFSVTTGTAPGNDVNMGEHKLEAARNFANKLWNASRFVLQNLEKAPISAADLAKISPDKVSAVEDKWILSRLNRLIQKVDAMMTDFQFGEAEREIHDFLWGEYCDWYIEITKSRFNQAENSPMPVLIYVLDKTLKLLHPFMPFITEEIWQNIRQSVPGFSTDIDSIMISPYPEAETAYFDEPAERTMDAVIDIVRSIRNIRAEYKVELGRWIEARVYADDLKSAITGKSEIIETLARVRPLNILHRNERKKDEDKIIAIVLKETEVVLPLSGMVDISAEKKRLSDEMAVLNREIERLGDRLQDNNFLSKAPEAVVNKEKEKLQTYRDKIQRLEKELAQLG
jgi:valyl-tRNA synthetase